HGEVPVRQRRGGRAVRLDGLHPHEPPRADVARAQHGPDRVRRGHGRPDEPVQLEHHELPLVRGLRRCLVQANSDYGNIIDPTKIVRNTTKMCQTDHCSFWNVGVTAIDLNEDLTNNDLCPCFDQFQNSTCRDTVTQFYPVNSTTLMFNQNYSWPTEKAAIALIASTAVPLYACPAAGATLGATVNGQQVQLTWPDVPPVTNYVVERADGGCGGTFAGIASTTTGSY